MASEIRTLKDKDTQVLPRTRADAVSTTDGSTVQDKINNIPTDLSELNQDSTHRLVTDAEKNIWNNKMDFNDIPTQLSQLSQDSTHRLVTDTEKNTWNNKSDFSGSYTDLTSKPSIPTVSTSVASTSTTTAASSSAVKQAYDKATAAMPKTGGTFTGTVYAGNSYQSHSIFLLRNTMLASSDTTPTINGQICWTYG